LPLVFLAMLRRRMSLVVMGSPVMGLFLCCTCEHKWKQMECTGHALLTKGVG
jgi:hypothetical protein